MAKSIIQAHTGPHIQAALGEITSPVANQDGLAFISDFTIIEGTVKKPPAAYNFPDLAARIRAVRTSTDLLNAFLFGQAMKNLPAAIYLVQHRPDLPASIFALLQSDLAAEIFGTFMYRDLTASLITRAMFNANLPAMIGTHSPVDLPAFLNQVNTDDLGAIIWSPHDLRAIMGFIYHDDLPSNIFAQQSRNLRGRMFGLAAPHFRASIRGTSSAVRNLAAATFGPPGDLPASIAATYPGPNDFLGLISATGQSGNLLAAIRNTTPAVHNLPTFLAGYDQLDLGAIIDLFGAFNLRGLLGTIPFGAQNRELRAFLQGVKTFDLGATMTISVNTRVLAAYIEALSDSADLGAFIRCAETFITALLTVSTLASRNLRAIVGRPNCSGGSAIKALSAFALVQHARNLNAFIVSHYNKDLGASINTRNIIHALDTISIRYSPRRDKKTKAFRAVDTVDIRYSPFRGKSLAASLIVVPPNADLRANIKAGFPLLKVTPSVSRILSADLRGDNPLNIQEVRLQLEGKLLEFFYVHGTDQAFINDPNEQWKINVRSFQPLAANLFGDFAAARICRLGSLQNFVSIDEAVRFCIAMAIGLQGQASVGAMITAHGQLAGLPAVLNVWNHYDDMRAVANRVYPFDVGAEITGTGDKLDLGATIDLSFAANTNLGATIGFPTIQAADGSLSAKLTAV